MQTVIIANNEPRKLTQLSTDDTACSLPLAGRSILVRLLDTFTSVGISDIIVCCRTGQLNVLERIVSHEQHFNIVFVEMSEELSVPDCLFRIRDRLVADYIFLTYSTVVLTELNLRDVFLNLIRTKTEMSFLFSTQLCDGSKVFKNLPKEFVLTVADRDDLVLYLPPGDVKKQAILPRYLVAHYRHLSARTDLREVGLYLLTKSALDTVLKLKDDVARKKPFVREFINVQQHRNLRDEVDDSCEPHKGVRSRHAPRGTAAQIFLHERLSVRIEEPTVYNETNRMIMQKESTATKTIGADSKKVAANDCSHIAADCVMHAKVKVASSFIGSGCTIGESSRIINSILLPRTVVKQGCTIQNCVVGEEVSVEDNCILNTCCVAVGQHVPAGTELQSESLGFTDVDLVVGQT